VVDGLAAGDLDITVTCQKKIIILLQKIVKTRGRIVSVSLLVFFVCVANVNSSGLEKPRFLRATAYKL